MSEEQSDKEVCPKCEQEIRETCPYCKQFVYDDTDSDDDNECDECGQELPDEDEDKEYEVIKRRHGVLQPICNLCKRPLETCPECKEDFDINIDSQGKRHYDADTDDEDDDEEEEDEDDDEDADEVGQKGKGYQSRMFYDYPTGASRN